MKTNLKYQQQKKAPHRKKEVYQKTKIEGKSNIKYLNINNIKGLTQKKKIGLSHTKIERKVFEFF